jgi:glutathione S-transferase
MTEPVHIIGSYISPYVRKVLAVLGRKGIRYDIDPIVPFFGSDRFGEISPLRRIPVYSDDAVTLCDSTVICEYLEDRHPDPAVYPKDPVDRARARWLEEFADTRMGEVIIWRLFNQVAINPRVFGVPTDEAVLKHAREVEVPHVLDYLESQLPAQGFLFGEIGVADIAIAAFFRNAAFSRYRVDAGRWPRTAAFVDRAHGHDCLRRLVPFEKASISVPPPQQRAALEAAGAPLSARTLATDAPPRRGIMSI